MNQQEYINGLIERETHSATMKTLSPLECEHLKDWRAHFEHRALCCTLAEGSLLEQVAERLPSVPEAYKFKD